VPADLVSPSELLTQLAELLAAVGLSDPVTFQTFSVKPVRVPSAVCTTLRCR
jgi:hypothetical protein